MRRFKLSALVAAALALSACASTPEAPQPIATTPPPPTTASVTGGLDRYLEQRARVENVGFRLRKAAAPVCAKKKETKPDIGLIVWSLANFPNADDRERLSGTFALTDAVTVALAVDGAPAARAGLQTGAIITHVDDKPVGEGKGATERFINWSNAAARKGPVHLRLADGTAVTATPQAVCAFPTLLVRAPEINAAADGRVLAITTGLFELTRSDDELALVLGHELAHNVLGHLEQIAVKEKPDGLLDAFMRATIGTAVAKAATPPYTIALEKEADYVGLYFMARAGYDIAAAEGFWRRLNEATAAAKTVAATHPTGEERLRAIQAAVAEIKAKQKAGKPLEPDLKPRR
jgi:Peptidase family M48